MKRLLSLAVFFLCCIITVFAQFSGTVSDSQGVKYTANNDESTCYVSGHEGFFSSEISIPEEYQGRTVTSIGELAFYRCSGLTSITIPESVTSIGDYAFYDCSGLTSITIGSSVTSIGNEAFSYCSGLTSITIPNSVTSIGDEAFFYCRGLTSITIGNSVTSIGDRTFSDCFGLTSITIPNSVTSIGYGAFDGCSGLTTITIPNSVTSIGDNAFWACSGLTSIVVEDGNSNYDSRDNCNALIESASNTLIVGCQNTVIPNGVMSIGFDAFSLCSALTSITIPNSVTSIGDRAFYNCSGLTSITIPNSVTSIGSKAFYCCSGLTSITIPNSVTSIGDRTFSDCFGLTSIVVEDGNANYDSRDNCNAIIESASNTLIAGCQNTVIPNSVTSIGEWAFYGCSGLTSITIPNSVTSIGELAFYRCSGLTSVISEIQEPFGIDGYAFSGAYDTATLMVPVGTKSKYEATDGWKNFANIVEMDLTPVDGGETVDFGDDIDDETNLNGNIVGDILFNISSDDGGYNSAEGCIVVNKPTDDTSIGEGQDIFGEEFRDNFTGIVFKVPAGMGTIKVEAQTTGNMVLKVKIGNNQPVSMELDGRLKATFPYNVTEPTFVYVYGGSKASNAPGMRRVATDANALKLYGITVSRSATSVTNVSCDTTTDNRYYTLDGRTYEGTPTKKGVYIVDGHTVIVK